MRGEVYKAETDCIRDGLDGLGGGAYSVSGDGVVVIYVEGSDILTFEEVFISGDGDSGVLFITQGSVEFSADIGTLSPTPTALPHIQASIIAQNTISFRSNYPDVDDSSIIVEGPLVTKQGAVAMNRNRGLTNEFPAVIVRYNPKYLVELTKKPIPGVSTVDVSWTLGN